MRDKIFTIMAVIIVVILFFMGKNAIDKGTIQLYYTDEDKSNNVTVDTTYNYNNMETNDLIIE